MIKSHLKFTNFDVILLTNVPEKFEEFNNARLRIIYYKENFNESILSRGMFNMHLKRCPLKISKEMGYENTFYNDCDCYIDGWDQESFDKKISTDYDIYFMNHANPQLGELRKTYKHFQDKIDNEFVGLYTEEMDNAPNPVETRILFKNNEKMDEFLHFWDKISKNNNNFMTYYDGVYFGTSAIYAKMAMGAIIRGDDFTKYCYVDHGERILTAFGENIQQ